MFGRRNAIGFDAKNSKQGFRMFNRTKIYPCYFHVHAPGKPSRDVMSAQVLGEAALTKSKFR
jgi:hypothetical protein